LLLYRCWFRRSRALRRQVCNSQRSTLERLTSRPQPYQRIVNDRCALQGLTFLYSHPLQRPPLLPRCVEPNDFCMSCASERVDSGARQDLLTANVATKPIARLLLTNDRLEEVHVVGKIVEFGAEVLSRGHNVRPPQRLCNVEADPEPLQVLLFQDCASALDVVVVQVAEYTVVRGDTHGRMPVRLRREAVRIRGVAPILAAPVDLLCYRGGALRCT
jgi:hypothetical protein